MAINAVSLREATNLSAQFADRAINGQLSPDEHREFVEWYPRVLVTLRRAKGVWVSPAGSRKRGLALGYFRTQLRDGTWGYFQRRTDDCEQAALATCAQVPIHQVPDSGIDKHLLAGMEPEELDPRIAKQLEVWQSRNGLRIVEHATPPWSAKRWIGVVSAEGEYGDHCLIMSGRDVLFDPMSLLPTKRGEPPSEWTADDIYYGVTIERS